METYYCQWRSQNREGHILNCYSRNSVGLFKDSFGRIHKFTKHTPSPVETAELVEPVTVPSPQHFPKSIFGGGNGAKS
jgi:hypothetical protein